MKRATLFSLLLLCALFLSSQELRHTTGITNVEVPVRVFEGDTFVDDLTLSDFEVSEDGLPQKAVAVYLVKKTEVLRKEEQQAESPDTSRSFYLFFEVYEYLPRLGEALSDFVKNVLLPGDELVLVTSTRTYRLKKDTRAKLSRDQVVEQVRGMVRRDTQIGNMEYNSTLRDLRQAAARIPLSSEGDIGGALEEYRTLRLKLESLRSVDEKKFLGLAKYLKSVEGQKYVFFFYQREVIPVIDKKELTLQMSYLDVADQMALTDVMSFDRRKPLFNSDEIRKAYSDASITVHFLYLTGRAEAGVQPRTDEEHSEDIFPILLELAKATGGIAESTANPAFAMKKASKASENYYLLYYVPANTRLDGKFRQIKVSIKGKGYSVSHRSGYFAD